MFPDSLKVKLEMIECKLLEIIIYTTNAIAQILIFFVSFYNIFWALCQNFMSFFSNFFFLKMNMKFIIPTLISICPFKKSTNFVRTSKKFSTLIWSIFLHSKFYGCCHAFTLNFRVCCITFPFSWHRS